MDGDEVLLAKIRAIDDLVRGIDVERFPESLGYVQALRMIETTAASALTNAVRRARVAGESWARIGKYLGVSPQAAHERYAKSSAIVNGGDVELVTGADRGALPPTTHSLPGPECR